MSQETRDRNAGCKMQKCAGGKWWWGDPLVSRRARGCDPSSVEVHVDEKVKKGGAPELWGPPGKCTVAFVPKKDPRDQCR